MTLALPSQLTKTLACAHLELQNSSPVAPFYQKTSTINSKRGILSQTEPVSIPKFRYFGIGVKGFKNLNDAQSSAPFIPSSANLDLYQPIPFRCVPVDEDLSALERAQYRMRVPMVINGENYYGYYLKLLEILDAEVKIIQTDITTGVQTELEGFTVGNLNPVPTITTAEGAAVATSEISVSITANMQITGAEVHESVIAVFNGDLLKARISEIGIYSGEDLPAQNDGQGGTYTEAIYTQLGYHYCNLGNDFSDSSKIDNIGLRISSANAFLI